jgi:hypothetical protein
MQFSLSVSSGLTLSYALAFKIMITLARVNNNNNNNNNVRRPRRAKSDCLISYQRRQGSSPTLVRLASE